MMKKLLLILFFFPFLAQTQNLVPNPDFEDTIGVGCPSGMGQSQLPAGWCPYSLSPDYFNVCSPATNNNSVPKNGWGYEYPYSGNAYCGIWCYQTIQKNTREFLGRQLQNPLTIGQKYYIKLKVCLAEISNCGIDKIGVLFSSVASPNCILVGMDSSFIKNSAHIFSVPIISDTMNWSFISDSFISDSSYQYILIGNFFDDVNTDTLILGQPQGFGYGAYYFIDDISVSTDSTTSINDFYQDENSVDIFPNPFSYSATVMINDANINLNNVSFSIHDLVGRQVMKQPVSTKKFKIDGSSLSAGVYIVHININNKTYNNKIIIIN